MKKNRLFLIILPLSAVTYAQTPQALPRTLINNATDDNTSALRVNGDIRLSGRGQNFIVYNYATFGETLSGAATVLGNNAIASTLANERIDFSSTTADGANAIVMSYFRGTAFHVKPTGGPVRNKGDKWFTTGDTTDLVMRLTPSRNILMGTNTDDGQHRLQVKGSIKATKVKVTQTGWADFVFYPSYQLPGLHEVEAYVKEHRHLPGIPSEKEVTESGLDIGETNKRLLQKIEELTLYIIDQNKKLEKVQKRLDEMETRLGSKQ